MARSRAQIYQKWSFMEGDPIISSAIGLLVTSALGGHETSGDVVFIEKTPAAEKDKRLANMVDEINDDLAPLFNRVAYTLAYNGAVFGDSYARIYADRGGIRDLYVDELVRPPIVQPYEKGTRTVGFMIYAGDKMLERLDISQLARLKMPRTLWVPQFQIVEKAFRTALTENDMDKLPVLPASIGGSFLYQAEEPYDNLLASLLGLVGQRWMDSIDEQMVGVNLETMTADQQEKFLTSIIGMLKLSKDRAENAVKTGQPVMERIRHIIPVWGEKQITRLDQMQNGRNATISVEDVMLHAKLLSGALGTDLSMLGFSELLSGGLGDGGFFRTSAQAAERARVIRGALSDCCNAIIDIHTMHRYGTVFLPSARPWSINFYGSISALESERQRTRQDAMAAGQSLIQAIRDLKDMGASQDFISHFLTKQMLLDEDQAKMYSQIANEPDTRGKRDPRVRLSGSDETEDDE
ncbi:putative portal protein [Cupriavidus basilensis]|uniref:Putative portal protein n=2 Tax=Cupriavidus basilensis TaxID=68895 RepID=A0A0C4Y7C1_9BURK|nr:putative portal protein [Cupriavidus basilensis]